MAEHPFKDIRDRPTGGRGLFLRALEAFRQAVPVAQIREAGLATIEGWPAWQFLRDGFARLFTDPDGPLAFVARAGADRGVEMATPLLVDPEGLPLLSVRERAARWAALHGGEQLGLEVEKTRRAVATTIARAIRRTAGREAARDIVAVRGFGLNPRQEEQLRRAVEGWRAAGANARTVRRRAAKLHKRLLLRRASGVWQYQKRSAIMEGARQAWAEGLARGQLTADRVLRWNHAPGGGAGHPCPRCASLIGAEAGILLDFTGRPVKGGGKRYNGRQLVRRRPPEHPS